MSSIVGLALVWALSAVAILLAVLLVIQARKRIELRDWLTDPSGRDIPDGSGAWQEIYSLLQRWRKEDLRERNALTNSLEHFRLAAQALPDGVVLLDAQGRIEWLNRAACEQFALDISRDVGILIGQLIRQREFHDYLTAFQHDSRAAESIQLRFSGTGAERVFSLMLLPFSDSGILLLSRDITTMVRTDIIRRDFVANVSHELRTPLTVICGFLEQFASDAPPKGDIARRFLQLMTEQATRMNRLVSDLLMLSRLENDSQPPRDEAVDMRELIANIVAEADVLSNGRHRLEVIEISDVGLRGSMEEIRSACSNLVSNAVRYTPDGGSVTITWQEQDGKPEFVVRDTGIGIPKEHLPRLTERFYRVDKGRSTATGGTGLGLAIVKHVLVRHGGSLKIDSEIGKGSTFSASFPADRKA